MIVSNYWKWLWAWDNFGANSDNYKQDIGLVNIEGNNQVLCVGYDGGGWNESARNRYFSEGLNAIFGNGTTEITVNDYNLSNDISSNITVNSASCTSSGTENGLHRTIVITGRNTSEQAVTITQVGVTKYIVSLGGSPETSYVMMGAFDLSEPLTVQPNDQFIINVEWNEA